LTVYTDDPAFARALLAGAEQTGRRHSPDPAHAPLAERFFGAGAAVPLVAAAHPFWRCLLVSGHTAGSQYDRIVRLGREGVPLPHGLVCVARGGTGLQGFRGRSWTACPGNLHLTVHLAPGREVPRFESVFLALAAVSVVEAIDAVPGLAGRAAIRWVNDVVIDGAKVAGVLAHTASRGTTVTGVTLGIGVNVETTPAVAPTAFVPAAAALGDFAPDPAAARLPALFRGVLDALEAGYRLLLAGGHRPLVERYRARSAVLGRTVAVSVDAPDEVPRIVASGRVAAIGDGLELHLDGRAAPVTGGRLVADPPAAAAVPHAHRRGAA
jgi:BirA family transcriptional regulator, biotin operon repressor / biotin---[acetyl-CoA-carboxylase] ligase